MSGGGESCDPKTRRPTVSLKKTEARDHVRLHLFARTESSQALATTVWHRRFVAGHARLLCAGGRGRLPCTRLAERDDGWQRPAGGDGLSLVHARRADAANGSGQHCSCIDRFRVSSAAKVAANRDRLCRFEIAGTPFAFRVARNKQPDPFKHPEESRGRNREAAGRNRQEAICRGPAVGRGTRLGRGNTYIRERLRSNVRHSRSQVRKREEAKNRRGTGDQQRLRASWISI